MISRVRSVIFVTIISCSSLLFAELPSKSRDLLEKLQSFEDAERKRAEALIKEKRDAVVKLLEAQLTDETKKGNLEGAKSIQQSINSLTGENRQLTVPVNKLPPGASKIPKDAIRSRGHYYKVFELNASVSWDQAREKCRAMGGDLGWLERDDDVQMLTKLLAPLVQRRGHAPIWVGAMKNASGEWEWLDGTKVDDKFWSDINHSKSPADQNVMIRWISSFRTSGKSREKVIGYLCRWE